MWRVVVVGDVCGIESKVFCSQKYSLIEVGPSTSVLEVGVAWHRAGKLLIHLIRICNLFLYDFHCS